MASGAIGALSPPDGSLSGRGVTRPGFEVRHNAVWHQLRRAGFSFKKTRFAAKQDRPKIARRREQWKKYQERLDPTRLVFIDETWAKTNLTPIRGWSRRGDKLLAKAPFGKWRTLTFLAALRHDRIDAPCVLDGPINGQLFTTYVVQFLVPTLGLGDRLLIRKGLRNRRTWGAFVREPIGCRAIAVACAHMIFLRAIPDEPDVDGAPAAVGIRLRVVAKGI